MKRTLPVLRWPGGKSRHLNTILPLIPEHSIYVEPFAGGLAVLLAKKRSPLEVVNDVNQSIIEFYRNARFHAEELIKELDLGLCSRKDFTDYLHQPGLTELQRAARWYLLNQLSWGGKGDHFGAYCYLTKKLDAIRALHARLDRVIIENLDYKKCLERYDESRAFCFIDPPYLDCDPGAYKGWTIDQMQEFAAVLTTLKSKWMVTVDDSPANRRIFKGWKLQSIVTRNALASWRKTAPMKELLITP